MTNEVQLVSHPFRRHSITRHTEGSALNLVSSAKPGLTPPRREKVRMVSRRSTPVYSPQSRPLLDCDSTVDSQVDVDELVAAELKFTDAPSSDLLTGITDEALRDPELVEGDSTETDDEQSVISCKNTQVKVLQFAQPTNIIKTFISYQPKVMLSPERSPTRTLTSRTMAFRPGQSPVEGRMTAQNIALYTAEKVGTDKNNEIEYEELKFEVVKVKENILRLEIPAL